MIEATSADVHESPTIAARVVCEKSAEMPALRGSLSGCRRRQLGRRRLRLIDADQCRLAALAHRVGRGSLREIATIATPDTLLRWHRIRSIREECLNRLVRHATIGSDLISLKSLFEIAPKVPLKTTYTPQHPAIRRQISLRPVSILDTLRIPNSPNHPIQSPWHGA